MTILEEADALIRDVTKIGSISKSEFRERLSVFAQRVREEEQKRCEKIVEEHFTYEGDEENMNYILNTIRKGGENA